jgi:hypothetical protein
MTFGHLTRRSLSRIAVCVHPRYKHGIVTMPARYSIAAAIDKELESKDNHKAELLYIITLRKGLMRHARI